MNVKTRLASAAVAGALLLGLGGCNKTYTWAAKYDGAEITPAMYMYTVVDAYTQAKSKLEDQNADVLKQKIEDKDATEWILETAKASVREYYATNKLFDDMGLTMTADDNSNVETQAGQYWTYMSALYENNGVGEDSFKNMFSSYYKQNLIFNKLYAAGGTEEVADSVLQEEFLKTYTKATYYPIATKDSTGKDLSDEDKAKVKARLEAILQKVKDGGSFYDAILEDEKANTSGTVHEHKGTEHDNLLTKENTANFPDGFLDKLKAIAAGETSIIEVDGYMMIAQRHELTADGDDYKNTKSTVLVALKSEDLRAKVKAEADKIDVTYNDEALKVYTPKKVKYDTSSSSK